MANYTETIQVRVTPKTRRDLEHIAEEREVKLSWLTRKIVLDFLYLVNVLKKEEIRKRFGFIHLVSAKDEREKLQPVINKMKASVTEDEWNLFDFHFGEHIQEAMYPDYFPSQNPETGEWE